MKLEATKNEYFEWICKQVCKTRKKIDKYSNLLSTMHEIEFVYSIPMDVNRFEDGEALRYRFARERNYNNVPACLNEPCSVLEMMVALSIRCEEQIMDDPDKGNRTSIWFWDMIDNLGLSYMTNDKYDKRTAYNIFECLLERKYEPDGTGGLFTINNCKYDLRKVEIWYQMCWHLNDIL